MGLHKILKIVALLLAVGGIISLAMVLINGQGLDAQMYIAYITLALTVLIVLIYVLKGIFGGNLKKTLMSIGAFLLVVIISYVMAEGVETEMRDAISRLTRSAESRRFQRLTQKPMAQLTETEKDLLKRYKRGT